jgi:TP901-1 family phage major tail protein
MPPKSGVTILLQVENAGVPGTYRTLGGQRGATLNRGTSTSDSTSKDSAGWEESLPKHRNWSINADALLLTDDLAYGDLKTAWRNGTQLNVRVEDSGATETGKATLTEFPLEAPHDDVATISITLQGSGALVSA